MVKAVKIVFGRSDQSHATSELKALEKIKSVRHPFLLSLERFEVVEGRLVVVMELADGSLRDRYRDCRNAGQVGIGRDELLRYLRDAADALDYLAQKHDLQHLDIKPENLLLVGGHVKIADFGLVKDLHSPQASIIGGMTPTYAAPELFQCRPTPHSDQYSLAIIFQELLTGTMPFEGTSAAELTLKHINELPSFDALSESDRYIISQALAKDPEHRFGSCSEMVEALMRANSTEGAPTQFATLPDAVVGSDATHRKPGSPSLGGLAPTATLLFDEKDSTWARETAPVLIDLPEIEPLRIVPQPPTPAGTWEAPATFVIGVGGAGRLALKALRASISESSLETLKTLLIDTNPQSINQAMDDSEGESALSADEVVCCPLRKPQDYRDKTDRLLKWMSRRWLYNIPRSFRTEGIRPLGRLAFVDHARQVMQRIRMHVESLVNPAASSQPLTRLRIYFVGSISGGSASGMLHDLSYATRAMLKHLGISSVELIAVTAHSPSRMSEMMELSRVNSFAWLTELVHWSHPDQCYPGDETAGIPPSEEPTPPFDHVYVLDLGDRVDDRQFAQAAQDIADYILLDATTPAGHWIEESRHRQATSESKANNFQLRTFAVQRSPKVDQEMADTCAKQLLALWASPEQGARSSRNAGEGTIAPDSPTTFAQFASLAHGIVEAELGGNAVGYLGQRMKGAGFTPATLTLEDAQKLIEQIAPAAEGPTAGLLDGKPLQDLAVKLEADLAARTSRWLTHLVRRPSGHPLQVLCHADEVSQQLAAAGDQLQAQVESTWQVIQNGGDASPSGISTDEAVLALWRQRLQWVFSRMALNLCEAQSKCVEIISQDVDSLLQCCQQFTSSPSAVAPPLLRATDERVRAILADQGGYHGLWSVTGNSLLLKRRIEAMLPPIIRSVALAAGDATNAPGSSDPWQLRSLGPNLRFQGGECSQLLVGPDPKPVFQGFAGMNYVQAASLTRAYSVFEARGLSPLHVAATCVSGRRDYADLAGRIHARRDVDWRPLLSGGFDGNAEATIPVIPQLIQDTQAIHVDAIASAAAMSDSQPY